MENLNELSQTIRIRISPETSDSFILSNLMHELTHAWLMESAHGAHTEFSHEDVCEFMACFAENICAAADAAFRAYKHRA